MNFPGAGGARGLALLGQRGEKNDREGNGKIGVRDIILDEKFLKREWSLFSPKGNEEGAPPAPPKRENLSNLLKGIVKNEH